MCLAETLGGFLMFYLEAFSQGIQPAPGLGVCAWPPMGSVTTSLLLGVAPEDVLNTQGHSLLFTVVLV